MYIVFCCLILGVKWERFFVSAGIPAKIAGQYAKKFAEQRVQYEMLGELTKPILIELGITALGDQVFFCFYFLYIYFSVRSVY